MSYQSNFHQSVLLDEVIEALHVSPGKKYIDATLGGGGHAREIIKRGGEVLGIDADPGSISYVRTLDLENIKFVQGNFRNISRFAQATGFEKASGILFDLGISSYQIEQSGRGFSFKKEEPLDMRMDPALSVSATDLANGLGKKELSELFTKLGQERFARLYAAAIVKARKVRPIASSLELATLIEREARKRVKVKPRIHPATRVFQAFRIAVNDELGSLRVALSSSVELLEPRGRLVIISFHSLEDREAKVLKKRTELNVINGLVRPTREELNLNPRASSAIMRIYEKK